MKIWPISDTHGKHNKLDIPKNIDLIIHSGDVSNNEREFRKFINWYSSIDVPYKIFVAGNHDGFVATMGYKFIFDFCKEKNIIYLEDTNVIINGIVIHGSPYTPEFCGWHFMKTSDKLKKHWDNIPDNVNILITHGPAFEIGDEVTDWRVGDVINTGCAELAIRIKKLKELKFHFFGHIHEGFGVYTLENYIAYNASILDEFYTIRKDELWTFTIKGDNDE